MIKQQSKITQKVLANDLNLTGAYTRQCDTSPITTNEEKAC